MSKNSTLLESKSYDFINLLTNFEDEKLNRKEKSLVVNVISRVLIHTSITIKKNAIKTNLKPVLVMN
jgi:hypothetical protein